MDVWITPFNFACFRKNTLMSWYELKKTLLSTMVLVDFDPLEIVFNVNI